MEKELNICFLHSLCERVHGDAIAKRLAVTVDESIIKKLSTKCPLRLAIVDWSTKVDRTALPCR